MSLIFDIKRYAINDGPGIRITLFMKGCPLSCVWCHNPEGLTCQKQILYTRKKCIGCQTCISVCSEGALKLTANGVVTDNIRCNVCGKCVDACPAMAMEISGTEYSIDYLMTEIEKETIFMDRSEGGVTFCGGEPLLHPYMLLELLCRCGELGIHRTVDTTLFAKPEVVIEIMPHTELFLVDLKHMDPIKHKLYCGVSNELILANLRLIAEAGKEFHIRIPLIEGVNADEENMIRTAAYLSSLPWRHKTVNLLLYHDIGKNKHEKLGTIYNSDHLPMSTPSVETVRHCKELFGRYGIEVILGG